MKSKPYLYDDFESPTQFENIKKMKENKLIDKNLKTAFKSIAFYAIFAAMTLNLAYQMVDKNTFNYQNNLKNLFGAGDKSTKFLDVFKIVYDFLFNHYELVFFFI